MTPQVQMRPEAGGVLDRDQARAVLHSIRPVVNDVEPYLDALAECVRPAAIDRDALRTELIDTYQESFEEWNSSLKGVRPYERFRDYLADRLLTTIGDSQRIASKPADREALVALLVREGNAWGAQDLDRGAVLRVANRLADRILALVRPVAGVTLTPDEVHIARTWYTAAKLNGWTREHDDALAARLEAAS